MVSERKIVDQVSGWLTLYDDGFVDRSWTGPSQFKFMAEPVPAHDDFINGVAVRDIVTNTGLRLRVYLPEKETAGEDGADKKKLPIVLHYQGGGFCISEASWYMYYNTYTNLARVAGAIVVSVYLRRAPEHRLPAAIEDGYSALLWLSSLAKQDCGYGDSDTWVATHGDFNRVFLIGDSSGANIVHHVAAMAGECRENLMPLRIAGGIPIHPGFSRAERSRSELENPQSPFLTLDMLDKFIALALPEGSTKDHPITCPMETPMDELNLPPYLLVLAEKDLLIDTEMEFYEAMKKANKKVELMINHGMGHSFYLNKIAIDMDPCTSDQTEKLIKGIAEFIGKH